MVGGGDFEGGLSQWPPFYSLKEEAETFVANENWELTRSCRDRQRLGGFIEQNRRGN